MAAITTGSFTLPAHMASEIWQKVQDESVVARLSGERPLLFGDTDIMTFTSAPKAEFVAESGNKSSMDAAFGVKTAKTHKAQVTIRMSQEVLWADEDYQLEALATVRDAMGVALSRALDLGSIHALNPNTGAAAASITDYITKTGVQTVTATAGDPQADLENAGALLIAANFVPSGIALDPAYAWTFKTAKYQDGRSIYPDLSINIRNTSSLEGLDAAVSDTVSASKEAATATGVKGIVGQWDALRWGVVREIPIETIEYGDPDGLGDLKRMNQIALRAETAFSWAILDQTAFAVIS